MKPFTKNLAFLLVLISLSQLVYGSDYYWVGGSGDWADLSHWATFSGGNTTYTTIPSADDNVFFDANSFSAPGQIVTVTTDAVCRTMNWTGANNPIFTNYLNYYQQYLGSYPSTLRIFGSLILNPGMKYEYLGDMYFDGTATGNIINLAGQVIHDIISFRGIGGEWTLMNDLQSDAVPYYYYVNAISLENGTLNTNGFSVVCFSFGSQGDNLRSLLLGNSVMHLQMSFRISGSNYNFDVDSAVISLEAYNAEMSTGNNLVFDKVIFTNDTSTNLKITGNSVFNTIVLPGYANIIGNNIFHHAVSLPKGGSITGSNAFDTLVFFPGREYSFGANDTQTIIHSWVLNGTCAGKISIQSTVDGTPCNVNMSNGTVNGNYLILKNVWVAGGAGFEAFNSIDLGNNNGWSINSPVSHDLFWVGNGGNWDDPSHWAYSSGGTGGACTPTQIDNVFFDQNSFSDPGQKVFINVSDAYCNNMNWTGVQNNPEIKENISQSNLRIFGSFILNMNMLYSYHGKIFFESALTSNTIEVFGKVLLNDITFTGPGGWYLADSLNTNSSVFHNNGHFNTNDQNLRCQFLYSRLHNNDPASTTVNFTHSTIYTDRGAAFDIPAQNLNSGTSTFIITGYGGGLSGGYNLSYYGQQFNKIIFTDTNASLSQCATFGHIRSLTFSGNGELIGRMAIDTLIMTPGYHYMIVGTDTIIKYISMNGTCSKRIYLTSFGYTGEFYSPTEIFTGNFLIIEKIHANGGGSFTADNSVDLRENNGWIINSPTPRNLFWVGNGGSWRDSDHWAMLSGGPGGACPPTPVDNVFFDQNSFNLPDQIVLFDIRDQFCKDFSYSNVSNKPKIKGGSEYMVYTPMTLKIFGSMYVDDNIQFINDYWGPFALEFNSRDTTNTIYYNGYLNKLVIFNQVTGKWSLTHDLQLDAIRLTNGSFHTNGFTVHCPWFSSGDWYEYYCLSGKLRLDSSKFYCDVFGLDNKIDLPFGNYSITANSYFSAHNRNINDLFLGSLNGNGTASLSSNNSFHSVTFNVDGVIDGLNSYDSLTLSAGHLYILPSQVIQTIHHQLNIRGNNCFPISLHSSQPGSLASLCVPSGTVTGDFLELQDIQATGGASFFAGNFSTNLGNNPGWTWGNAPGYVYGFLTDTTICQGDTLILKTDNFNGGTAFLWQDGSTGPTYKVTQSGTYSCRVTYADNCYIQDSIHVTVNPVPQMSTVPLSQVICSGETCSISLGNTNNVPGTSFLWNASLQSGNNTSGFSSGSGDHISQTLTNNGTTAAIIIYTVTPWFRNCAGTPVSASVIVKAHASSISGKLKYDNDSGMAISCSMVYLKTLSGMIIDSSTTDYNGMYRFCDVPNGSYKLIATSSRPWGGVNATDAFLALKHFANLGTLTGLRYIAGDVNNTGYINSVDALLMATRYVELTNSFIIGDWQFEKPTVTLTQITDLTVDILGLCTGDVNGSYVPPGCGP